MLTPALPYGKFSHRRAGVIMKYGTQSTPRIYNGRLYVLSSSGRIHCLDAVTGGPSGGDIGKSREHIMQQQELALVSRAKGEGGRLLITASWSQRMSWSLMQMTAWIDLAIAIYMACVHWMRVLGENFGINRIAWANGHRLAFGNIKGVAMLLSAKQAIAIELQTGKIYGAYLATGAVVFIAGDYLAHNGYGGKEMSRGHVRKF